MGQIRLPNSAVAHHIARAAEKLRCQGSQVQALQVIRGRDTLRIAREGFNRNWAMRQESRSPAYTTRWEELLVVPAKQKAVQASRSFWGVIKSGPSRWGN